MRLRRVAAANANPHEFLDGANRAFGNWGGEAMFAWAFRNDAELLFLDDEQGRTIAGSGIVYRTLRGGHPAAIMTGSWTSVEGRGRGAFSRMIDTTCKIARERGAIVLGFGRTENASRRRFDEHGAEIHPAFYCRSVDAAVIPGEITARCAADGLMTSPSPGLRPPSPRSRGARGNSEEGFPSPRSRGEGARRADEGRVIRRSHAAHRVTMDETGGARNGRLRAAPPPGPSLPLGVTNESCSSPSSLPGRYPARGDSEASPFPSSFEYSPDEWRAQFLERPGAPIEYIGAAVVERTDDFDRVHAVSDPSALPQLAARAHASGRRLFWYTTSPPSLACEWTDGFIAAIPELPITDFVFQNGDRM